MNKHFYDTFSSHINFTSAVPGVELALDFFHNLFFILLNFQEIQSIK